MQRRYGCSPCTLVKSFSIYPLSVSRNDLCNPEAILVLLTNDLVAIDCRSTGLPSYENPYAMDFQVGIS